ncbi:MAG: pilus assembly protein N-terminal domain-containing protein [Armatimonadetes bacterium]|nr:pilus assembly protein N-terminal domain-containing protein [Armatimonadota bacterium]
MPASGRLFLPGCAIAAGLLAVSAPLLAAPPAKARPKVRAAASAPMPLRVGKTENFPLPRGATVTVEEGFQNVYWSEKDGTLTIKALSSGELRIRIDAPNGYKQIISRKFVEAPPLFQDQQVTSQIVERAPSEGATPERGADVTASPTSEQAPSTTVGAPSAAQETAPPLVSVPSPLSPDATGAATPLAPSLPLPPPVRPPAFARPPAPALPAPARTAPVRTAPVRATPVRATITRTPARQRTPQISAVMPAPARNVRANVTYRTVPNSDGGVRGGARPASISVTQGLARLISFPDNILAVFFSDPTVMDARAINARTIAVTGLGPGASTLAVFTSQKPGDVVGRINIYRIQTQPRGGVTVQARDPRVIGRAVTAALNDPRVRATIITLGDGSLATLLQGTVRNEAEVQAALTTASFFGPRVISSLYTDPNSPTLDAVLSGTANITPEGGLQENLRRITGNTSIELVPLPTGLAFKAEVNSVEEAQALMRVLPTLNQQVIPFIVVRGQANASSPFYNSNVPFLQGEDRQLTQRLHDVTGINTVYAVRGSSNSLACYGTVRTRQEYDTVRRFMLVMAQTSVPPAIQGTSQGGATLRPQGLEGPVLRNYDPAGGYLRNLGLQMFVRITDPGESVIRKVTVETSIVEISRTALKNLGVEVGSATLLGRSITLPTVNPNTGVQVTPGVVTSTIDPTFRPGVVTAGNGFSGNESLQFLDPFRARINALVNNGDARLLARPNVTAIEGAAAQITLGGERPVPTAVATQGAVGTSFEFRRFGVIISMRPTVTSDNTILLQIRADITQPDRTFEVNAGGAIVPGESVRSIDTTLNVRPGDTIVMGGLLTNERRQQLTKIPILGDLPIIGSLFRSKRFENNETELAIFMSPRIESQPADMEMIETVRAIPSFPALPSRQESNEILFQPSTRSSN